MSKSYASVVNSRFENKQSHVVSLQDRWATVLNQCTPSDRQAINQILGDIYEEFKKKRPDVKSFNDLLLTEAAYVPLSTIMIDCTMQRRLIVQWCLSILSEFKDRLAQPICIYRDEQTRNVVWEGQHTSIVLWLIATMILKEDPANIMVPVNISREKNKAAIRDTFIRFNSTARTALDSFDLYEQKVYSVLVDGSKDEDSKRAAKKQKLLEENGLFVTHKRFDDYDQPGAISRMTEIDRLNLKALRHCLLYLRKASRNARPIDEKEMVMMGTFFELCDKDKIKVDDDYVQSVYDVIRARFNCKFGHRSKFWKDAKKAFDIWQREKNKNTDNLVEVKFRKEPSLGMPFLLATLKLDLPKNFPLPTMKSTTGFWPILEKK